MQTPLSINVNQPADLHVEGGIDLVSILSTLKRHALLITGVTLAIAGAAGVRAYLSPTIYSSEFEILIQPLSAESEVLNTSILEQPSQRKQTDLTLADQTRILTSPGVLQPVVEDARAKGLLDCIPPGQASLTGLSEEELQQFCYAIVRSRLGVELTDDSRITRIEFRGESSEEVQYLATLIAQTFLDYGLATRQRDIQQGLEFLNEKLPDVQKRVEGLEADLEQLRQANNLITPEAKGGQLSSQVSTFENQYLALLVELEQKLTLYEDLEQELARQPKDTSVSSVLSSSSRYQALVANLLELDSQMAEASTLFLDSSPDMQALIEQRNNLLSLLAREGDNARRELLGEIEVLGTQEAALRATLGSLNVDINGLASLTRQFTDLERDLAIATNNLNRLLERRETLEIEAAQRQLPWELISPPTLGTSTANLTNNLVLGGLLGLLLGTGLAFLLDSKKDVLYSPRDLKRITPVPILGLIPFNSAVERGEDEQFLLTLYEASPFVRGAKLNQKNKANPLKNGTGPSDGILMLREAFRSLMANLQRVEAESPIRSIVISTADDELADSTTAAYLAWAAAELGNRVLLIDADFRFPHLHNFLGLSNEKGFGNVLSKDLDLKGAIKQSPIEPNLFVLTTGTTAIDPVRLLSSTKIKEFVNKVESYFDLVIYDSPPFSQYADASLLAAETSGLALVSQLGTVKSNQLEQTLEKLWISKIPLIGLIAKEAATKLALLPV